MEYYIGQRLSLKAHLCTVRYFGPIDQKLGTWLGVEWDDHRRGKHNGTHDNVRYFVCKSKEPAVASFLNPSQTWDSGRTFLQALREKYVSSDDDIEAEPVYFSSKQAEEVGFKKFAKRQAQLQGISVVVLDHMRIYANQPQAERKDISQFCAHITELDLGSNLFEHLSEITSLCTLFPKLRRLVLDGNRLSTSEEDARKAPQLLDTVRSLSISSTPMTWLDACSVTVLFPNVTELRASSNAMTLIETEQSNDVMVSIDLSSNNFSTLSQLEGLSQYTALRKLILKRNSIEHVTTTADSNTIDFGGGIEDIDLAYNKITSWSFINAIPRIFPNAKHLRVTGNPLYEQLRSPDGKLLTSDDGHMLTIARLPQLQSLNFSKITDKERLNAETYYLSQITTELSLVAQNAEKDILANHPRWEELCKEYGKPQVVRAPSAGEIDPNSLGAKLLKITFTLRTDMLPGKAPREWMEKVPRSVSIYTLLGIVGKELGVMPLKLRLLWETDERDPTGVDRGYAGPQWYDSSDEGEALEDTKGGEFALREVELVAGTRPIGTYVDGADARIRVEWKSL